MSKAIAIEMERRLEKMHPELFRKVPRGVWRKAWCSFIKPYGENQDAVMKYLSRYVFRIAITNARLTSIEGEDVVFRYKDRSSGKHRTCRLDGVEFLRRYLMHVLPRGLHKVRYYGLWHHSRRPLARRAWLLLMLAKPSSDDGKITIAELIEQRSRPADEHTDPMIGDSEVSESRSDTPRCPHCGGQTTLIAEVARHGRR